jgi:hypothetical protein
VRLITSVLRLVGLTAAGNIQRCRPNVDNRGGGIFTTKGQNEMARQVKRTRNGGTWTEAQYWGRIRGALRKAFAHWKPSDAVMERIKVPYTGDNPRKRFMWRCEGCGALCERAEIRKDHVTPCGPLRSEADVLKFIAILTSENPADFQGLCVGCHQAKTNSERQARK